MKDDETPTVESSNNGKNKKKKKDGLLKKGVKEALKNEKVRAFIITHLPYILIGILIIIAVIYIIGLVLFFINMPGLVLGSIDEFGRNLLGNLEGLLWGDQVTATISEEDVIGLAQHLEMMGYDIQGYGLGSVKYKDDGSTASSRNGKAREIEKITESVDGKQYLRSYIAANENTYVLSEYSVAGALKSAFDNFIAGITSIFNPSADDVTQHSAEEYSTGLINVIGDTDHSIFQPSQSKEYVSIDRDSKQMKIYNNAFKFSGIFEIIGRIFGGTSTVNWGETFSYDLDNWIGRYGRPTELFLALHLSTMMPDLTYDMATKQEFNTKVNIALTDARVEFSPTATKGNSTIDSTAIMSNYLQYCAGININGLSSAQIEEKFEEVMQNKSNYNIRADDSLIPGTEWTTKEISELAEITHKGSTNQESDTPFGSDSNSSGSGGFSSSQGSGDFAKYNLTDSQLAQLTYVAYREQGSDQGAAAEASLMANLYEQRGGTPGNANGLVNYVLHGGWFAASSTGSSDYNANHNAIVKEVLVNGKRTLPSYVVEHDYIGDIAYVENNGVVFNKYDYSKYIKDVTVVHQDTSRISGGGSWIFYSFPAEGSDPFGYFQKGEDVHYDFNGTSAQQNGTQSQAKEESGIKIKWPFIASVTNHWYYNDIDFATNAYRLTKKATKTMEYTPEDDSSLGENKVSVKLDAIISSDKGVVYQVSEPEATGPNDNIVKLFNDEYYKYDGTTETAFKIAMKKAQDSGKSTFSFNGQNYTVNSQTIKDIKKEKVSFKENKPQALTAFGILGNMHTQASDYIYRDLKELMVKLKHFTSAELTDDLQNIMLWPIKTDDKDSTWETSLDAKEFGTTIKCNANEQTILAPMDATVKKVEGNSVTFKITKLNDEAYKLLTYIYSHRDPFKKINRELLTGYELTISDISLKGISVGSTVKRGQEIGSASGNTDGKKSINITLYQLDKSLVEDIEDYLRQYDNNKDEEVMKKQKDTMASYKKGIDVTSRIYNSDTQGNATATNNSNSFGGDSSNAPASVKEFVEKALSVVGAGYSPSGYYWSGDVSTSWFTCSGLVDFALGNSPRTNNPESFYAAVQSKGNLVTDTSQLKYGDLVFYQYAGRYPGHVAIYIGNGKEVEADGSSVAIHDVGWMPFIGGGTYL